MWAGKRLMGPLALATVMVAAMTSSAEASGAVRAELITPSARLVVEDAFRKIYMDEPPQEVIAAREAQHELRLLGLARVLPAWLRKERVPVGDVFQAARGFAVNDGFPKRPGPKLTTPVRLRLSRCEISSASVVAEVELAVTTVPSQAQVNRWTASFCALAKKTAPASSAPAKTAPWTVKRPWGTVLLEPVGAVDDQPAVELRRNNWLNTVVTALEANPVAGEVGSAYGPLSVTLTGAAAPPASNDALFSTLVAANVLPADTWELPAVQFVEEQAFAGVVDKALAGLGVKVTRNLGDSGDHQLFTYASDRLKRWQAFAGERAALRALFKRRGVRELVLQDVTPTGRPTYVDGVLITTVTDLLAGTAVLADPDTRSHITHWPIEFISTTNRFRAYPGHGILVGGANPAQVRITFASIATDGKTLTLGFSLPRAHAKHSTQVQSVQAIIGGPAVTWRARPGATAVTLTALAYDPVTQLATFRLDAPAP